MGGKGKKKGGKDGGEDDKYDPAQMQVILQAQVQSLKERLSSEQERRDQSQSVVDEIRESEQQMLTKIETVKENTEDIVRKMTASYNKLQEEHYANISKFNEEIGVQREMIR